MQSRLHRGVVPGHTSICFEAATYQTAHCGYKFAMNLGPSLHQTGT